MIFGKRKVRLVWGFFMRPVLPFAVEFVLLAPLVLAADLPQASAFYLFLAPWILLAVSLLNLPLLGAVFSQFKMDRATRRNHALEHATILVLAADGVPRLAGRAAQDGFRVSGGATPNQIRHAFNRVAQLVKDGQPLPHVSRHCGSNRVTALGLAILLLLLVCIGSLIARPPLAVRAWALAGVVVFFSAMRHAVGNWLQRRFFMATDFSRVAIEDLRQARPEPIEEAPVYFVTTVVS